MYNVVYDYNLKEVCSIVIYFKMYFFSCDAMMNSQQSHDPSEISLIAYAELLLKN